MLYALLCDDREDGLALRLATRADHLAYLNGLGARLKFAGPFLGPDETPVGSLVVVDASGEDEARSIAANDPYAKAGLFRTVSVRRWNRAVNGPDG